VQLFPLQFSGMNTYVKKIHAGDSLILSEDDNNNILIDIYDANSTSDFFDVIRSI
jgi:hypothetical protein